jgi:hypothetical protein
VTKTRANDGGDEPNLGSRYGEIGISAITAALQFTREVKSPEQPENRRQSPRETDEP